MKDDPSVADKGRCIPRQHVHPFGRDIPAIHNHAMAGIGRVLSQAKRPNQLQISKYGKLIIGCKRLLRKVIRCHVFRCVGAPEGDAV